MAITVIINYKSEWKPLQVEFWVKHLIFKLKTDKFIYRSKLIDGDKLMDIAILPM